LAGSEDAVGVDDGWHAAAATTSIETSGIFFGRGITTSSAAHGTMVAVAPMAHDVVRDMTDTTIVYRPAWV
jgi:hypothetical protein